MYNLYQSGASAINIKNIGIVNNREYEEGILHLEFPDEAMRDQAKNILTESGYTIHLR